MKCQCHAPRHTMKHPQLIKYRPLGDVDWGGIVGNAIQAYGSVQQNRNALTLQRAQFDAALRARELENQAMLRRQAQTIAQPLPASYAQPASPAMMRTMEVIPPSSRRDLPPWLIPAAAGAALVAFLVRK